jgi:hypothetical protein
LLSLEATSGRVEAQLPFATPRQSRRGGVYHWSRSSIGHRARMAAAQNQKETRSRLAVVPYLRADMRDVLTHT